MGGSGRGGSVSWLVWSRCGVDGGGGGGSGGNARSQGGKVTRPK